MKHANRYNPYQPGALYPVAYADAREYLREQGYTAKGALFIDEAGNPVQLFVLATRDRRAVKPGEFYISGATAEGYRTLHGWDNPMYIGVPIIATTQTRVVYRRAN